jgi:hypothetical protein
MKAGHQGQRAQADAEVKTARKREALAWALETGTVHDIVEAYRQARERGESELTAFDAAPPVSADRRAVQLPCVRWPD